MSNNPFLNEKYAPNSASGSPPAPLDSFINTQEYPSRSQTGSSYEQHSQSHIEDWANKDSSLQSSYLPPDGPPPQYSDSVGYPSPTQSDRYSHSEDSIKKSGFDNPTIDQTGGACGTSRNSPYNLDESGIPEPDLSFTYDVVPPASTRQPLPLPVVFPQLTTSFRGPGFSPFSRGYSPALQEAGVSLTEWLAFVDGLNLAFTANPPLQILGLAGSIVGMVPHHIPQLVGTGLNLVSSMGSRATTKLRSESYINEVNARFFNPRGLAVAICPTKDMSEVIRHPQGSEFTLPPITSEEELDMAPMSRRYLALQGLVCPVTFEGMPPARIPDSALEQMSARQIARQTKSQEGTIIKERRKEMEKAQKRAEKQIRREEKGKEKECKKEKDREHDKKLEKIGSKLEKLTFEAEEIDLKARKGLAKKRGDAKEEAEIEKKRQKELTKLVEKKEKLERKWAELEVETGRDSLEHDVGQINMEEKKKGNSEKLSKEAKSMRKILWIVVTNLQ